MSYFEHTSAARRYATSRPYFHPVVGRLIERRLGRVIPLNRALDVACGTGQSTRILSDLANYVVGTDASRGMLAQAQPIPNVAFARSSAERLPFVDASFDLLTVALAFHWFDREAFLNEARRVLSPNGLLVIYDNAFLAEMEGNPAFRSWFVDRYIPRYPSPPRNRTPLTDEDARSFGFTVSGRETYRNDVEFDRDLLADYLMTQSNIIAAIEEGNQSPQDVRDWLVEGLTPFFSDDRGTFHFGGPITYLQRADSSPT